ncbi:MAG: hypothetical protein JWP89_3498 [Schlesneria sp.]|nr:hypothetical protein [Schlesneria sp.]
MNQPLTILSFGIGAVAVVAVQFAYWVKIEPTLRFLKLIDQPRFVGFWNPLFWEYKNYCVREREPLIWWWIYWACLWTVIVVQVGLACLGLPIGAKF